MRREQYRALRIAIGISQTKLSDLLDISIKTIRRLELECPTIPVRDACALLWIASKNRVDIKKVLANPETPKNWWRNGKKTVKKTDV